MTGDDALKTIFGVLLAGISAAVVGLVRAVFGNRDKASKLEARVASLEAKVQDIDTEKLTHEGVRKIVDDALDKRDKRASERRAEFDKILALEIKQAVTAGQEKTKADLELMVPRIVRETIERTKRHNPPSGSGATA